MIYNINKRSSALLIIDAQNEYFSESCALFTAHAIGIRANLVALRAAAHEAGMLSILIKHVHRASGVDAGRMGDFDSTPVFTEGTLGVDIIQDLSPTEKDVVVTKNRYSAFVNTELESVLRGNGVDTIIVTGLMTQYCSVTTARHGHDLDYRVIFVSDANAGPDIPDLGQGAVNHQEAHRVILGMLAMGVADIQTTAQVITGLKTD